MTNHSTLEHLSSGKNLSAKMIRWTLSLNEFNIEHRPGAENTVADCLLRAPRQQEEVYEAVKCALLTSMVIQSRQQFIEKQRQDPELSKIIQALEDPDLMPPEELKVWG